MGAPAVLPLGTIVNATVAGSKAEGAFKLYSLATFTIGHHVPAGSAIAWAVYDLPAYGPEKKELWGEIAEALGVEVFDSKGNSWGGGSNGHPSGEVIRGFHLTPVALNAGDTVTVRGYNPPEGTAPPPLSMYATAFAVTSGSGPPRLLLGSTSAPSGGAAYAGGWNQSFKGNAGQAGYAMEIVEQWLQDNAVPSTGEGEENLLGVWVPAFKPTPEANRRAGSVLALDDLYPHSGPAPTVTHTITPHDMTLGEGPLKHGGWRLDVYVKVSSDYVADAGSLISECMSDGSETTAYGPWGINGRTPEHPNALHLLQQVLSKEDYSPLVSKLVEEVLTEGAVPTRPRRYDTHLLFRQTGVTDVRGRVCGSAPFSSGPTVSGYWMKSGNPLTATVPDNGDLYVGGVLVGAGVPLEWTEAQAITGIEAVATGKEIPPAEETAEDEEVVGGTVALAFQGAICPTVSSVFNTLSYTWEAHIVIYFPPDIHGEEAERAVTETEEHAKENEEEIVAKEKAEEEKAKEEGEKGEHEGGGTEGEKPAEETAEEKKRREEREATESAEEPGPSSAVTAGLGTSGIVVS